VIEYIKNGYPPKLIGQTLRVSPGSVRNYIYTENLRIYRPDYREWTDAERDMANLLRAQGTKSAEFVSLFNCTPRQAHSLWLSASGRPELPQDGEK
jgi:DNA-binding CsgD family transcriptional regulator